MTVHCVVPNTPATLLPFSLSLLPLYFPLLSLLPPSTTRPLPFSLSSSFFSLSPPVTFPSFYLSHPSLFPLSFLFVLSPSFTSPSIYHSPPSLLPSLRLASSLTHPGPLTPASPTCQPTHRCLGRGYLPACLPACTLRRRFFVCLMHWDRREWRERERAQREGKDRKGREWKKEKRMRQNCKKSKI